MTRKILLFGNSGSGKSTLARKLCESDGLAHLDLDTVAWQPTNPPTRKPLDESKQAIEAFMADRDGWVIEGCYTDLLMLASDQSTEIIYMDLPIDLCVSNAKKRPWEPHKYASKEAQDTNLAMLINWIKDYCSRDDTFSKAAHAKFYTDYSGKKTSYNENL